MPRTKDDDRKRAEQVWHLKRLRQVAGLLSAVHEVGCGRDKAHNRELHFDDYVMLVLLWMFNPLIDSLSTLQRLSDLEQVQKKLGIKRFSMGSFSESCRVFEPAMLKAVVEQLAGELAPVGRQEMFKDLPHLVTLVDGTTWHAARVVEAMWLPGTDGKEAHARPEAAPCTLRWIITSDAVDLSDAAAGPVTEERARTRASHTTSWTRRAVPPLQPDQRHRLQLRLPREGQQRVRVIEDRPLTKEDAEAA